MIERVLVRRRDLRSVLLAAASLTAALGATCASLPARADETLSAAAPDPRPAAGWKRVGVSADVGLPDGLVASLVLRPLPWLRLAAGGGSNGAAAGFRGGLTLLPLGTGPSLTLEAGHYAAGPVSNALALVRDDLGSDLLDRVSYSYANAHAGLELGKGRVTFYLHAGLSYLRARLGGSGAVIEQQAGAQLAQAGSNTRVVVPGDLSVSGVGVSGKVGLLIYLD